MTLEEFLHAVLPSSGILYIIKKQKYLRHIKAESINDAVAKILQLGSRLDTYYALASYEAPYKDKQGKTHYRTKAQVKKLKSLWWDIDIGKEGCYQTKKEAVAAVLSFCRKHRLPFPLFVDSGGGVHVYWPLAEEVTPDEWLSVATALRSLRKAAGIRTDPAREVDICSILRPPGTNNFKYDPPRPVRILCDHQIEWPIEQWRQALPSVKVPFTGNKEQDDLFANLYQDAPADANLIAQRCAAVRQMRDTGGRVPEPHWRAVIGVLRYCENGLEFAHEWSKDDSRYDPDAVEDRYHRWQVPPPTCEYFEQLTEACEKCRNLGKVTTPLQLGRRPPKAAEEPKPVKVNGVKFPPLPKGFEYRDGILVNWVKSDEGDVRAVPLTQSRIHGVKRVKTEEGYVTEFVVLNKTSGKLKAETMRIPTSLIGAGGADLKKELGRYEVFSMNHPKAWSGLVNYLQAEVERLREQKDARRSFTQFGWHGKDFLLGDTLYTPYGPTDAIQLDGVVEERSHSFTQRGELAEWIEAVHSVYDVDGMEPMQYVIACAFGSVLGRFLPSIYRGIPVAITGSQSGQGKTTVAMMACSAFGDPDAMFLNSEYGATHNARNSLMGAYQNLPILIDEITRIRSEDLSRLLYAISNGMDKLRMIATGTTVRLQEVHRWNMVTFLTANTDLNMLLRREKINSYAESMRIVEIDMDEHSIPKLQPFNVEQAIERATANCGSAGHTFVQWVVEHQDKVRPLLDLTMQHVIRAEPRLQQPEYRFWRMQAATAFAALLICTKLGVLRFDYQSLLRWYRRFAGVAVDKIASTTRGDFGEAVNHFFLSLNGHTITTALWRSNAPMESLTMVRGQVYARQVIDDSAHPKFGGKILVLESWLTEWCNSHRLHPGSFLTYMEKQGIVTDRIANVNIATGTHFTAARGKVIVLDPVAVSLAVGGGPSVAVVDRGDDLSSGV